MKNLREMPWMFIRRRKLMALLLLFLFPFLFNSCTHLPTAVSYTTITVRLSGFIHDCFSGDQNNGTSTSHVNYNVHLTSEEYSGGSYKPTDTKNAASPAGTDKSQIDIPLQVPNGVSYRINVTIDATECSKCNQSYCNNYRALEYGTWYVFNAGRPYWVASVGFRDIPASNIISITPISAPRYPNQYPPENCDCKIKDN